MKALVMASTLIVTLVTVGLVGEPSYCDEARTNYYTQHASLQESYLLASCEAAVGAEDMAFVHLAELKAKGFDRADWLQADVQFESLHQDQRWHSLMEEFADVQQEALASAYVQANLQ